MDATFNVLQLLGTPNKTEHEGWASYESKGLIPYCFWRDRDVSPDEILTESDTPYLAGVFDGIYKEGEAILEIPEMINNLDQGIHQLFYAYTVAYLKCRGSKIQENQTRFEELLNKLAIELCKEKPIAIEKNVKNKTMYCTKFFKLEPCVFLYMNQ